MLPQINRILNKYWGELFFCIYLILASSFYKERTLFLDNAFQSFLLIQDGIIEVNANRWPAVINRVLPYLAVQLSLELKAVLYLFSVNYVLVHFGAFALVKYYLKDQKMSLILIAFLSLPVLHGFYWSNSELILGICFYLVFLSALRNKKIVLSTILAIILAWVHPLILMVFVFGLALEVLNRNKHLKNLLITSTGFLASYLVKQLFFPNWYDRMKSKEFASHLSQYGLFDFDLGVGILWNSDLIILATLIISLLILSMNRSWIKVLILISFSVCYLLILDISSPDIITDLQFYHEINLYPLFLASVLCLLDYKSESLKIPYGIIMVGLSLFLCIRVSILSENYSDRIVWYKEISEQYDRCILDSASFKDSPLIMEWASAYESLIISSLYSNSKTILITDNPGKFSSNLQSDSLLTEFRKYAYKDLNIRYFTIDNTNYSFDCLD